MKLAIDLQSWSDLVSAVTGRQTRYEELTELDQVTDRLALEEMEGLFEHLSPEARAECMAIINKKLGR